MWNTPNPAGPSILLLSTAPTSRKKNESTSPSTFVPAEQSNKMEKAANEVQLESTSEKLNPQVVPNAAQANDGFGGVRLSPFWKNQPKLWFIQLEYQFVAYAIHSDDVKLGIVLWHLDDEAIFSIADALKHPGSNKYEHIKAALIQKYSEFPREQFTKLLEETELGEKGPAVLLQEMRTLAESNITDDVLRKLWLQKLPKDTQELLIAVQDGMILDKVAEFADTLLERMLLAIKPTFHKNTEYIKELKNSHRDVANTMIKVENELKVLKSHMRIMTTSHNDSATIAQLEEQLNRMKCAFAKNKTDKHFLQVHVDIIGPFPNCEGYRFCLTMGDYCTKWPEATPIKDASTKTISKAFIATWVSRFGCPKVITTSKLTQFKGKLFTRLTRLLGCETIVPLEPNGLSNQWQCNMRYSLLSQLAGDEDWVTVLPLVLLGLRSAYRPDLQGSPAGELYLKNLTLPNEFLEEDNEPETQNTFIEDLRAIMNQIKPELIDQPTLNTPFVYENIEEATHVFVKDPPIDHLSTLRPYSGPYKVLARNNKKSSYMVLINGQPFTYPVDRLKPAFHEITDKDLD